MTEPSDVLQVLADKQAIADVIARYCRGVDRLDLASVRACYHDDGVDHHTGFTGVADDYVAWLDVVLRRLDGTQHVMGTQLIEVDGDRARAETYGTAYHWVAPYDDPTLNFTSGLRYVDRFERRDGVWRIAERWAVREWTRAVPAELVRPKEGVGPSPTRDRNDPIYLAWPTWP
ncbi:MAG TPA: nuclear transport factor 2 family protein [Acidimicrobiales bacterium]|nr:nuclear transport factor 2 family protein [Acidimicrobiales bacterium]